MSKDAILAIGRISQNLPLTKLVNEFMHVGLHDDMGSMGQIFKEPHLHQNSNFGAAMPAPVAPS